MAEAKKKIFAVSQKVVAEDAPTRIRLIRAERRSQVEAFIVSEINIAPASHEDCFEAAKNGVVIEETGE